LLVIIGEIFGSARAPPPKKKCIESNIVMS